MALAGDSSDVLFIQKMVDTAVEKFGSLDVVIANAGITLFGAVFFAFKVSPTNGELQPSQRQKLLATVGVLLESQHYSPKAIDDAFSKEVFSAYFKALDPEKNTFLQLGHIC